MSKLKALSIDAEFTSFDMIGGDMISFAAVEVYENLTLGREWQGYLKPRCEKYFTDAAAEVHGISWFKALTFPEKRETILKLLHWLKPLMNEFPVKTIFWGSWDFDLKWLETTMKDDEVALWQSFNKAFNTKKELNINLMKMAKEKLKTMPKAPGEKGEKGRYALDNAARFYDLNHTHHDALSDARVTAQIYCNIMRGEKVWTGELF